MRDGRISPALKRTNVRNSHTSQITDGKHWGPLGSGVLQGQQNLGNSPWFRVSQNHPGRNIRNNKRGCRCSKTGSNGEKVVTKELFIWEESRAEKGRNKGLKKRESGKGVIRNANHTISAVLGAPAGELCAASIRTIKPSMFWLYHTSQTCFHGQDQKQRGEGKGPWLSGRHTHKQVECTGMVVLVAVAGLIASASTPTLPNIYKVTKNFRHQCNSVAFKNSIWGFVINRIVTQSSLIYKVIQRHSSLRTWCFRTLTEVFLYLNLVVHFPTPGIINFRYLSFKFKEPNYLQGNGNKGSFWSTGKSLFKGNQHKSPHYHNIFSRPQAELTISFQGSRKPNVTALTSPARKTTWKSDG